MAVHHFLETHKRLFRILRSKAGSMLSQDSGISLVAIALIYCVGFGKVEINHVGVVISWNGSLRL